MIEYFTPNDLIRYIYQEMPEEELEKVELALRQSPEIMQEYLDLMHSSNQLDQLMLAPSEKVSQSIKKLARSSTGLAEV